MNLKLLVSDEENLEKMNRAFSDLRADYELDLSDSEYKINELQELHIDYGNNLSKLKNCSLYSSGLVKGLRGTGKTHLFLLARDYINANFNEYKSLCFYINLKRLTLPTNFDQEIFNRVFSVFMYDNISNQLFGFLDGMKSEDSALTKFIGFFGGDRRKFYSSINAVLTQIIEFRKIALYGNEFMKDLSYGKIDINASNRQLNEFQVNLKAKLGITDSSLDTDTKINLTEEDIKSQALSNQYLKYLNLNEVRKNLIQIKEILNFTSVIFYIDEWEKLYSSSEAQAYLANFIDQMNDTPIYFWIGMVPNRGSLYKLNVGSDLQHVIDLDENLKMELSPSDKLACMDYYKKFIDKRLNFYFPDLEINHKTLFSKTENLQLLVLGSMGNTRDFGTILLESWSEYATYRKNKLGQGRPFNSISKDMIIKAIRKDGKKKLSNIQDSDSTMQVWKDLEKFCVLKKSSHLCIETSRENLVIMSKGHFSDLIYNRLLHFRKENISAKNTNVSNELALYALSYSCVYDLHQKDKSLNYYTDYESIHDRVRRYIYSPTQISNYLDIKEGEIILCKNSECREVINLKKMKKAVENNECPFCGEKLFNN